MLLVLYGLFLTSFLSAGIPPVAAIGMAWMAAITAYLRTA